jgi:hypothetical protein
MRSEFMKVIGEMVFKLEKTVTEKRTSIFSYNLNFLAL